MSVCAIDPLDLFLLDTLHTNTDCRSESTHTLTLYECRKSNQKDSTTKDSSTNTNTKTKANGGLVRHIPQVASSLFFQHNEALSPPYHVLVDTNFINFSIQNKLELVQAMMDCLYAKCIPCITDCVMAELEKLGVKYRIALRFEFQHLKKRYNVSKTINRVARDPRFERLPCSHKGTYADDCLVNRILQHRCYIVATCDRDLKRRIRKVPGVPIMYIAGRKYAIERLPEVCILCIHMYLYYLT